MPLVKERRALFKILLRVDVSSCPVYSAYIDAVFVGRRALVFTAAAPAILIPYGDLQYKTSGNGSLIA